VNANERWSAWLIEELVAQGVALFCISPGSRSTPLTVSAARHPTALAKIFHDERAAAYFALGFARATGAPAALICTSGTAAANYFPAVIEANVEHLPLLVLSADRPPELQHSGANQTIEQTQLFGAHVRWFHDPGCPREDAQAAEVKSWAAQAVHRTLVPDAGPVHLNLPFREPFLSSSASLPPVLGAPHVQLSRPVLQMDEQTRRKLEELLQSPCGVITVGGIPAKAVEPLRRALSRIGWPVFADIASGLRFGELSCRITLADQALLHAEIRQKWHPTVWLHIGNSLVSKRYLQWWETCEQACKVVLTPHTERQDPVHRPQWRVQAHYEAWAETIETRAPSADRRAWLEQWQGASQQLEQHAQAWWDQTDELRETSVVRALVEQTPEGRGLFVGNSLPVREIDMLAPARDSRLDVAANRGASGIDGLLATACGWAEGRQAAVTAVLGDVSTLHDLNSLLLMRNSAVPIVLVVFNNDGGGIFQWLPISQQNDVFEGYFATPHGCQFEKCAEMFSLAYFSPKTLSEFREMYAKACMSGTSSLIEVATDRQKTFLQQQEWQALVRQLQV
jgi:2-succinyl-5-enolpyruvyl-6-hydroxy-3-cyclohexene-1-carboxylate synthase